MKKVILSKYEWFKIIRSIISGAFFIAVLPIIFAVIYEDWPIYKVVWFKYLRFSIAIFILNIFLYLLLVLLRNKLLTIEKKLNDIFKQKK